MPGFPEGFLSRRFFGKPGIVGSINANNLNTRWKVKV